MTLLRLEIYGNICRFVRVLILNCALLYVSILVLPILIQIRIFKRLDPAQNGSALRMESGILKLYLVNCVQTKRQEKIKEFFDKMALELQVRSPELECKNLFCSCKHYL